MRSFPGKGKQHFTAEQAEVKCLRRELEIVRQERDVLKKAVASPQQNSTHMGLARYRMLGVSKAGYFTWQGSAQGCKAVCRLSWARMPISKSDTADDQLGDEFKEIHGQSKGRYGVPRVHAELKARGNHCSRRCVAHLMNALVLCGKSRRKYKATTETVPGRQPAPYLVAQNYLVKKPNSV